MMESSLAVERGKARAKSAGQARSMTALKRRDALAGYLFLLPSLVLTGIFLFYPLLKSIYLSLYVTDPRGRIAAFAGLGNYRRLFADPQFLTSLKATLLFTLYTVPAGILIALALAGLTQSRGRIMKLYQFVFTLPVTISVGTASVIWMLLFHPTIGMLNYFLGLVGLPPVAWLTDPSRALLSISLMTVWMQIGFQYVVLMSGLRSISPEIYESAKIDGSGPFRTFVRITVPLLSPTLFFLVVVSIITALQSFGQIHILTKGGPMNRTDVFVYNIYQDAFVNFHFGSGSAQALVLFVLMLLLTAVQFLFFEKKVHYQ